jgi:PncC family amidohydrolase
MRAIILSIGDELTLGQTVDTNSAWLSQQLAAVGCDVVRHLTVGDGQTEIESAIRESIPLCDFLICSGGIGPTEDDLTRQALAGVLGTELEMNQAWLAHLQEWFHKLNRPMSPLNRVQAMIPRGAQMIENTAGSAAGIAATVEARPDVSSLLRGMPLNEFRGRPIGRVLLKLGKLSSEQVIEALTHQKRQSPPELLGAILVALGYVTESDITIACAAQRGDEGSLLAQSGKSGQPLVGPGGQPLDRPLKCRIFCMPGVPKEMKAMFTRDVLPQVRSAGGGAVILSRTLHTFGMGESNVAELLKGHGDLMMRGRNPSVGTTVSGGVVSLRLNARFPSAQQATSELAATEADCRAALGDLIYGQDDETLPLVVARLLFEDAIAQQSAPALATAESCTGGLLAKYLTDVPGSSRYFRQGYITYQDQAKTSLLGVSSELIAEHGAVSEPVAQAMAGGARQKSGAAFALGITGIAGPGGGTPAKPVGTVCIALATPQSTLARTFTFFGDRDMIRDRSAKMALTLLRFHLLGKTMPF